MVQSDVVNLADLKLDWPSKGSRFQVGLGDIDQTLGGLTGVGATLHVLPGGRTTWPFHRHHGRISFGIAHGNDKQPRSVFEAGGKLQPLGYWDGEDIGDEK